MGKLLSWNTLEFPRNKLNMIQGQWVCSPNLDIKRKLQPGLNAVDGSRGGLHTCHHCSRQRLQDTILVFWFICSVDCICLFCFAT